MTEDIKKIRNFASLYTRFLGSVINRVLDSKTIGFRPFLKSDYARKRRKMAEAELFYNVMDRFMPKMSDLEEMFNEHYNELPPRAILNESVVEMTIGADSAYSHRMNICRLCDAYYDGLSEVRDYLNQGEIDGAYHSFCQLQQSWPGGLEMVGKKFKQFFAAHNEELEQRVRHYNTDRALKMVAHSRIGPMRDLGPDDVKSYFLDSREFLVEK